jgi:phenylpyruvate tautomerase PptA (4-oxalocrotonate tautomerase family)
MDEAELERKRVRVGRLAAEVTEAVVNNLGGPPRAETVKFEAWDAIELVY